MLHSGVQIFAIRILGGDLKKMNTKFKKLLIIVTFVCLVSACLSGCTNKNDAERALKAAGYTDIHIDGYAWFACSDDDFYHTKFTANNPVGQKVHGVVCSGLLLKNATIRF